MTTKQFLDILEQNKETAISFEYESGSFARIDYHITEIKNVTFDSVDCGGVRNQWQEVHIQLWESKLPNPIHRVNTTKALDIFNVVNKVRETLGDVEIKFEYGNNRFHTAIQPIQSVSIDNEQVIVRLGKERTTCKANDRAKGGAVSCC